MERERAERERNRTTSYLWSSSAREPSAGCTPSPGKARGGLGSPAYTQSSAYRHSVASKHAWQPPELQHNFASGRTEAAKHLDHPVGMQSSTATLAASKPSLLDGFYDEDKAQRDFKEALQAWRGPATSTSCTATTSTAVSTASTKSQLPEKGKEGCTMFHRLAIGYRSQAASLQAAQNCACENVGDAAGETSHAPETLPVVNTETNSCTSAVDVASSSPVQLTVQPPEDSVSGHTDDAEEDVCPDSILSISNLQLAQALTSKIRLPDAVHVPVTVACSHDSVAQ